MLYATKCDGSKCQDCREEARNIEAQNHKTVEEAMQKEATPKNPFTPIITELKHEVENDKTLEEFAQAISTGDIEHIFSYLKKLFKGNMGKPLPTAYGHRSQRTSPEHFKKAQPSKEEIHVKNFRKAVENGYVDIAMSELNSVYREITKQKQRRN